MKYPEVGTKWLAIGEVQYEIDAYDFGRHSVTVKILRTGRLVEWPLPPKGEWFTDTHLTPLMEALL